MAENQHPSQNELERLRTVAAKTRAQAIRTQIAAGLTFCGVAETQLGYGRPERAHQMLERTRKLTETLRRHLYEANHVPLDKVEKVRTELEQLESRIRAVEERERRSCFKISVSQVIH